MEAQRVTSWVLENQNVSSAVVENELGTILDLAGISGSHDRLQAGQIRDQSGALLGLLTQSILNSAVNKGFGGQVGSQIFGNVRPHPDLNEQQHRRRQSKNDRQNRAKQLGPKMLKGPEKLAK